jgi:hypothetical protein
MPTLRVPGLLTCGGPLFDFGTAVSLLKISDPEACLAYAPVCGLFEMSRRDGAIVAWHEVPGRAPPQRIRPVGYGVIAGVRTNRSRTSLALHGRAIE